MPAASWKRLLFPLHELILDSGGSSGDGRPGDRRWRVWDSCFTADFSYLHGGSARESTAARYRQWATHKLAAWSDQFGVPSCVGSGRCVTWCPAGIDLLAEVAAVRAPWPAVPTGTGT